MKRTACQYAVVRFLPFVETGEFANVGVVMMAPELPYFDFRLEYKKTGRVTQFFHELDAKLYRAVLKEFTKELARVQGMINDEQAPLAQRQKLARNLFAELTRERGNLVQFSNVRAVLTKEVTHEAERLFQYYVERNFAPRENREKQLEQKLRNILRQANLADRFRACKLGTGDFEVHFPFVEMENDRPLKVIRPLELDQLPPKEILERGVMWGFRIQRLRNQGRLPGQVLFATDGPKKRNRLQRNAFDEACEMLAESDAIVLPIGDRAGLIGFARA